ncbi:MAG: chromosomal replication initiator protein DnaA [Candidatus Cloacimonetes bacterium]|nr:chromosomal replication initiator protein DnaA [Candidatus Cloacimonadota bacterium]
MTNTKNLWQEVLDELKTTWPSAFSTWLNQTYLLQESDEKIVIACPQQYYKDFILSRYKDKLEKVLQKKLTPVPKLEFVVKREASGKVSGPLFDELPQRTQNPPTLPTSNLPAQANHQPPTTNRQPPTSLNRNYTFDNFVIGNSNRVAQAAALAITEKPGLIYNPLFVHGATGMGKTHLLHAIGNDLSRNFPQFKILYFTSERFLNDFVSFLRQKRDMTAFRQIYRNNDAILVDDIQFLGGKEGIQEAFYHAFNELFSAGRQIVLASDRLPQDIENLAERLVSRFRGGLMVNISRPDFETRLAIVSAKAADLHLDLSSEMQNFIAEEVSENIREVEGALLKIKSESLAEDRPVTMAFLKELLVGEKKIVRQKKLTPELLLNLVTETFATSIKDLCGRRRKKEIVIPRQVAMFLLRDEIGLNFSDIGEILGGRDHTTVMHGCDTIKEKLNSGDSYLRTSVRTIRRELYE